MNKNIKNILILILFLGVIFILGYIIFKPKVSNNFYNLEEFAKCLTNKGAVMYGAYWCPHCKEQKKMFGSAFQYIKYVECTEKVQECLNKNIKGYPTWIFKDGSRLEGEQSLEVLSEKTGCELKENI